VVDAAVNGSLPDAARWILDSRLVYLQKKKSLVPRPIRIGELLRRVLGKRLKTDIQSTVAKTFLEARQFGAGVPGGADILIAFRLLIESEFRVLDMPLAIIDVDLENFSARWSGRLYVVLVIIIFQL